MFPIKDYNPTHGRVLVVPALIAINIVVFLFVQPVFGSDREQTEFFVCKAAIPYEVTHRRTALEGASTGDIVIDNHIDSDEIAVAFESRHCPNKSILMSILYSMFLHGGILHIAGNMLFLWVFGNNVEDRLGKGRFVAFYLLCGLVATLAQSYATPSSTITLIGASGAIAGVLGAYIVMFPRARILSLIFIVFIVTTIDLPAFVVLGLWFLMQVFQSVGSTTGEAGGVAYLAHAGGFVAGMALLLVFRPRRARPPARFSEPY